MDECFHQFDQKDKGYLDECDFTELLLTLITGKTKPSAAESNEFFKTFDKNNDGKIDLKEFETVWNWMNKLLKPVTAFLIIDVQNDFIDGTLAMRNCPAKQEALEIIPIINSLVSREQFDFFVYSMDHHPENHISFFDNLSRYQLSEKCEKNLDDIKEFDSVIFAGTSPEFEQKLWPRHCIKETWGNLLYKDLRVPKQAIFIFKGTDSKIDSYSAFFDNVKLSQTGLLSELQKRHVTHVFVCGLAYDYCVAFTSLDSLELGYATAVIEDATRGTDVINIELKKKELKDQNAVIVNSSELTDLISGKEVRLEFAKVLLKNLK